MLINQSQTQNDGLASILPMGLHHQFIPPQQQHSSSMEELVRMAMLGGMTIPPSHPQNSCVGFYPSTLGFFCPSPFAVQSPPPLLLNMMLMDHTTIGGRFKLPNTNLVPGTPSPFGNNYGFNYQFPSLITAQQSHALPPSHHPPLHAQNSCCPFPEAHLTNFLPSSFEKFLNPTSLRSSFVASNVCSRGSQSSSDSGFDSPSHRVYPYSNENAVEESKHSTQCLIQSLSVETVPLQPIKNILEKGEKDEGHKFDAGVKEEVTHACKKKNISPSPEDFIALDSNKFIDQTREKFVQTSETDFDELYPTLECFAAEKEGLPQECLLDEFTVLNDAEASSPLLLPNHIEPNNVARDPEQLNNSSKTRITTKTSLRIPEKSIKLETSDKSIKQDFQNFETILPASLIATDLLESEVVEDKIIYESVVFETLKLHNKCAAGEKLDDEDEFGEFQCDWAKCCKLFKDPNVLYDHVLSKHLEELRPPEGSACDIQTTPSRRKPLSPNETSNSSSSSKRGPGRPPDKFRCKWNGCQISLKRGDLQKRYDWLLEHFTTRHAQKAQPFKCLFAGCHLRFRNKRSLHDHLSTAHDDSSANLGQSARRNHSENEKAKPTSSCFGFKHHLVLPYEHDAIDTRTLEWMRSRLEAFDQMQKPLLFVHPKEGRLKKRKILKKQRTCLIDDEIPPSPSQPSSSSDSTSSNNIVPTMSPCLFKNHLEKLFPKRSLH